MHICIVYSVTYPVTSITSTLYVGALMAPAVATYEPREPSSTVLYKVIAEHLETFLASLDDDPDAKGLPAYVQREFYDYLQCGILAHGFLRLGCDTCKKEVLLAFSCRRRGFCPSCAGRRMAQTAAHLVECVMPWVPTRQWVVSVPIPLRYWMASSRDLTAQVHTVVRTTIAQYYVNQAVRRSVKRQNVQSGSVSFIQRFGSSINLNLHFHVIFLEGVYLERSEAGLKPRFVKTEPPSNADIAEVLQKISCWTTNRNSPARWWPRLSSASLLGNGLGRKCAVSAQALAMKGSGLNSKDPAVPASTVFRCMPTPMLPRIGVISSSV